MKKITTAMFGNLKATLQQALPSLRGSTDLTKAAQHIIEASDLKALPGGLYRGVYGSNYPLVYTRADLKALIRSELENLLAEPTNKGL